MGPGPWLGTAGTAENFRQVGSMFPRRPVLDPPDMRIQAGTTRRRLQTIEGVNKPDPGLVAQEVYSREWHQELGIEERLNTECE